MTGSEHTCFVGSLKHGFGVLLPRVSIQGIVAYVLKHTQLVANDDFSLQPPRSQIPTSAKDSQDKWILDNSLKNQWAPTIDYAFKKGMAFRDDSIMVLVSEKQYHHAGMAQPFWPTRPVIIECEHFGSREHPTPGMRPYLEIEYGVPSCGGTGTSDEQYQICTGEQMNNLGRLPARWHQDYKLMADISLADYSGGSYNIIGISPAYIEPRLPFTGIFDGNYHSISGFSYS